ncbi:MULTISPECIES: YgfZ/GcvT domain-containing protein [Halomonadaceae]|uniref:Folate-binding protein YgfZ n=1 Tax=Vreelandella piezotolerans TaxID=2609667 RepID=A0ABQ6X8M2_9GAMM|nr:MULTISPECIES: folate-binding protein YgfZ [Halomonas]KAE8438354.1 folate-binding protein YgfZ [Halomonas piezotolerans]QJA24213.1 folate-binding protein YgfZ [Halomonas piezotolerans]TNH15954.1 folate-binding protein YgfZ [Halomonas sp. BL6]|tara:strand:- start:3655 stop:4611 length:957 start_codon:yes stop_codon:yes gene_type:complete
MTMEKTPPSSAVRLDQYAALDIKGADAEKFLQGQTSAQVGLANGSFAPLTCFCTPKGRMLANGQLCRLEMNHYRLILDASLANDLAKHLNKFAAFYKAELSVAQNIIFAGASESAENLAYCLGVTLPKQPYTHATSTSGTVLRLPGSPRWLFMFEEEPQNLLTDSEALLNAWKLSDIRSGLAWLTAAQQDQFLPQMLNWEALGGISFKKGCYTGQEVVARAHFRGQVKKRLVHARAHTASLPELGATLMDESGKSLGEVVSSATSDDQHIELLAVMNTKVMEDGVTVYWQTTPLTLQALPYPIERLDPEQIAAQLAQN